MSMLLEVGLLCLTGLIGYIITLHYDYTYRQKQSSLEKSRNTREKNKKARDDADKWNAKRIEFVNYVKDIMKSSMLNDDAKVGLVLNALLGFFDDDVELEDAAKTWNAALSKNKRKADNVVKSVNDHEIKYAPVALPMELQPTPIVSRSNSPTKQTQEELEVEIRAKEWKGRSKSPVRRPAPKKKMSLQEELKQRLGQIKV